MTGVAPCPLTPTDQCTRTHANGLQGSDQKRQAFSKRKRGLILKSYQLHKLTDARVGHHDTVLPSIDVLLGLQAMAWPAAGASAGRLRWTMVSLGNWVRCRYPCRFLAWRIPLHHTNDTTCARALPVACSLRYPSRTTPPH